MLRKESDSLGKMMLPQDDLVGIHTYRALENFNIAGRPVHSDLIRAMIIVKKAAAMANDSANLLPKEKTDVIVAACDQLLEGDYHKYFQTDALQGGAGTSTNMNINEVIANVGLTNMGYKKGDYEHLHPLNDINRSQSTNDVYPTALRIAAIGKVRTLAESLAKLQTSLQQKEDAFSHILKLGRTQLMDALPITLGQEFGAYARAISRDRWRIYKVEERLREVGIGGTAVGTGLNTTTTYIYRVTEYLQDLTGYGIARSDLLIDTMQNMDVFVEVSGFLKACATNLIKIANDLRLMNSGPRGGLAEISLKPLQAGSSIMPGKINPVICENTIQGAIAVIGYDTMITQSSAMGQLELNPFLPLIADSLLTSLDLLTRSVNAFTTEGIQPLTANEANCLENVEKSSSLAAALIEDLGYDQCAIIAKEALANNQTIKEYVLDHKLMDPELLNQRLSVYDVTRPDKPRSQS